MVALAYSTKEHFQELYSRHIHNYSKGDCFFPGVPQNTLFGSEIQGFNVLALRCCFCRGLQLPFHWTIHSGAQNNVRCLL